jgi:Fe-S cluster assembly ATP-binding protein
MKTIEKTKYTGLELRSISVAIEEPARTIINVINLSILPGTTHVLMGPNGSGKSTLALTLMGHPAYRIIHGSIFFNNIDITQLEPHKRAQLGIFLSFQAPYEMPGVSCFTFLRESYNACKGSIISVEDFRIRLEECMSILGIDKTLLERGVNTGASGGEKKQFEMLQLMLLEPALALLDEVDSGLDVDALMCVGRALEYCRLKNPHFSVLIITHYQRLLYSVKPEYVHVMRDGSIIAQGDRALAERIELEGYERL